MLNETYFEKAWARCNWDLIAATTNAQVEVVISLHAVINKGHNDVAYGVSLNVYGANDEWGWKTNLDIPQEMLDTEYFLEKTDAIRHGRKVMETITKRTGLKWVEGKSAYARRVLCFNVMRSKWLKLKEAVPQATKQQLLEAWAEADWHQSDRDMAALYYGAGMCVLKLG